MFGSLKEKLKNWTSKVKEEVFKKPEKEESKKTKTPSKSKKVKEKPTEKKQSKKTKEQEIKFIEAPIKNVEFDGQKKVDTEKIEQEIEKQETKEQTKQKSGFFSGFFKTELTQEKFDELFQELEMTLLQNNVAYQVVEKIKQELSKRIVGKKDYSIEKELKEIIQEILIEPEDFVKTIKDSLKEKKPYVVSLVGINGSGKTTTIAKLTKYLEKNKLSVCLAAADTYRAASIEQLETHANNLKVPMIKKEYGTDPASVGFEAVAYAKKNNIDVVLIDTAGRLNNKESLMRELEKIIRVTNSDAKIFIGESTTGNDATEQAKSFNEIVGLTGIILSKADVDEKGGTMISVSHITKKPILFLGTGQNYQDLEPFKKQKIIESLGL